jgi:hypothetical protein
MSIKPTEKDYIERVTDGSIELFRNSPVFNTIINGILDQVNDAEEMFFQLLDERSIDNATGATLDIIGIILGKQRYSLQTDDSYRLDLKSWIRYLFSQGEINTLIFVLKELTDSNTVILQEYFPGHVIMLFDGTILNVDNLISTINKTAAAGVRVDITPYTPTSFRFDSGPGYDQGLYSITYSEHKSE